ncbi:MAG: hypothetical protein LBM38_00605 [Clostridiales bacterium]|jgi:hypothetical protein|nr:hypothetical protein [Clostridiales bacterium]
MPNPWEDNWQDYYDVLLIPPFATDDEVTMRIKDIEVMFGEDEAFMEPKLEAIKVLNNSILKPIYDAEYQKRNGTIGAAPLKNFGELMPESDMLSVEAMDEMMQDNKMTKYQEIAAQKIVPERILIELLKKSSKWGGEDNAIKLGVLVAENPSASNNVLVAASENQYYKVHEAAAKNPNATTTSLLALIKKATNYDSNKYKELVPLEAVKNPNATVEVLEAASKIEYSNLLLEIAQSPKATEDLLIKFGGYSNRYILEAAAQNPNATQKSLVHLMSHGFKEINSRSSSDIIGAAVLNSPACNDDCLTEIIDIPHLFYSFIAQVAEHNKAKPKHLMQLLKKFDITEHNDRASARNISLSCVKHNNADEEVLKVAAKHYFSEVVCAAIESDKTTEGVLSIALDYAKNANTYSTIRNLCKAIINSPKVTDEILTKISEVDDKELARLVQEKLDQNPGRVKPAPMPKNVTR